MNRRTLLKGLGLGLSAGWMAPGLLSCSKDDPGPEIPFDGSVAIIGAGAAGLYAAEVLNAKGINVFILEASAQLGGRIKSLRNQLDYPGIFGSAEPLEFGADFPIELGAEFFDGTDSIWGKIIQNLNIPIVDVSASANRQYVLGNEVKDAMGWQGDADFESVINFLDNLPNYSGAATSVQEAAAVSQRAQRLLNAVAGNFYGTDSNALGARLLAADLQAQSHDGLRYLHQANPFQDILLSRFNSVTGKVQFETSVASINYGDDVITIVDSNGTEYQASKVIVCVPLSVLKSGNIQFLPSLPANNTAAFQKFGMDACVRAVIEFRRNFWGTNSSYIFGGERVPQYFNSGLGRSAFNRTLSITAFGSAAASLSALSRDAMISTILQDLDTIYDGQASAMVRTELDTGTIIAATYDWTKDQFIRGGISYPLPNATLADRENLRNPVQNKVFFAGEACDVTGDAGTINGALASAERAAQEVIDAILAES